MREPGATYLAFWWMGGERLRSYWGGDGSGGGGGGGVWLYEGGKTWEGGISVTETVAHFFLSLFLLSIFLFLSLFQYSTSQPPLPHHV
jgi:hypothetical protein